MRKTVTITRAQFRAQADEAFRRQGILSELTPAQRERAKKLYAIIGAFFKPGEPWEQFEHNLGYNPHPDFDLDFHEWVAERFQAYRKEHPKCGTFKLRREYRKLVSEFFKTHPVCQMRDRDTGEITGEVWLSGRRCA